MPDAAARQQHIPALKCYPIPLYAIYSPAKLGDFGFFHGRTQVTNDVGYGIEVQCRANAVFKQQAHPRIDKVHPNDSNEPRLCWRAAREDDGRAVFRPQAEGRR